jgi:hypothetical protein
MKYLKSYKIFESESESKSEDYVPESPNQTIPQYCYIGIGSGVLDHIKKHGINLRDKAEDLNLYRELSNAIKQAISTAHNQEKPIVLRVELRDDIEALIENESDPNTYTEFTTSVKIVPNRIQIKKGENWEDLI